MSPPAPARSGVIPALPLPLRLLGAALVYVVLGWLAQHYLSLDGVVGIFWPASGWALGLLLLGGRRYAWSVALGAFVVVALNGAPLAVALIAALGATASALLGHWLLQRDRTFDPTLLHLRDYGKLIVKAAVLASGVSALLGVTSATLFGFLPPASYAPSLLHWWVGDAMGVMVLTPLLLIWRQRPAPPATALRRLEAILLLGAAFLVGQMVFMAWLPEILPELPRKAYLILAVGAWAALRLGPHAVTLLALLAALQVSASVRANIGFLANDAATVRLIDGWLSLAIFGAMTMALATYFRERQKIEADLRIAATAFECQEGMIITDADQRILRVNHSFTRITGYSPQEVLGRTTTFMRSDRHPPSFYENAWRTAREQGMWNDEVWHRRRNGEVFPQWLTATAVKDGHGVITNFVVTHTDISYRKRKEAEVLANQLAQRDALVREVHHRIKNNLQGITGLLRQFVHSYPETAEPINQAIGQVRSIAVIHGLQGRSSERTVRLCELTGAIASDIAAVWQVPVRVDIPAPWTPCIIAEAEAVPLALVLNELITNAVKHGNQQATGVEVRLRKGEQADHVQVRISNTGVWQGGEARAATGPVRSGLQLVEAMLPRSGAQLLRDDEDGMIHVWLMLAPPVISLETERKPHVPDLDAQIPAPAGG